MSTAEEPSGAASPAAATSLAATSSWRPMAFGDGDPTRIADPLYEPHWRGRRVLVDVAAGAVTVRDLDLDPGDATRAAALRAAIAAACLADALVLDGYLVPGPLRGADAAPPPRPPESVTRGGMLRHWFVGSNLRRRPSRITDAAETAVALPASGPIAFVAVDLLWLDGEPLVDLPLGERRRLLESVVEDGQLVRRIVAVRAPAERWHGQWRALGFEEIAVKAANGRYEPGGTSRDWVIIPIPRS